MKKYEIAADAAPMRRVEAMSKGRETRFGGLRISLE